jgi:hypothetical protein
MFIILKNLIENKLKMTKIDFFKKNANLFIGKNSGDLSAKSDSHLFKCMHLTMLMQKDNSNSLDTTFHLVMKVSY